MSENFEETSGSICEKEENSANNISGFSQTEKKNPKLFGVECLMDKLDLSFNKIYQ